MPRWFIILPSIVLTFSILLPALLYFLQKHQEADFTLHFKEQFGAAPDAILRGKVVWITGASSGIGEHLAYEFMKHGSKVILSARRAKELERVKDNCIALAKKHGRTSFDPRDVLVLPLDLLKRETHSNLSREAIRHFKQIDILVNNAGILQLSWAKDVSVEADKNIMDINYLGTVSVTKAVLPHMIARKGGHIVVVNSAVGKHGYPLTTSYAASKSALKTYFEALRLELLGHSVEVSTIFIGLTYTEIWGKAHTSTQGRSFQEMYAVPQGYHEFMTVDRCVELMITAVANRIDESWISLHPELAVLYMTQYTPSLYSWFSKSVIYNTFLAATKEAGMPLP